MEQTDGPNANWQDDLLDNLELYTFGYCVSTP
jgi:hypothetical protein